MNEENLTRAMIEENPNYVTFRYEPEITTTNNRTISADAFAGVIDTTTVQTDLDTIRELQEYLIAHLENEADTYAQIHAARAEDMRVRATDGTTARIITADEVIPADYHFQPYEIDAEYEQLLNTRYSNDWTVSNPYLDPVHFRSDYKVVWGTELEDKKRKAVGEKPSAEQVLDFLTT